MIITVMQRAEPEGYSYGEGTGKRLPMAKVGGRGGSRRLALWEGFGHARLIKKAKPLLTIIWSIDFSPNGPDYWSLPHFTKSQRTSRHWNTGSNVAGLGTPNPKPAPPPAMAAYMSMGEAHHRIGDYLSRVADAISCSDGTALASLLAVSSAQASTPLTDALAAFPDFPRLAADRFPNLSELFVPFLRTIHSHSLQRYADAYSSFEKAAKFVPTSSRFNSICLKLPKIWCWFECSAFLQEFRNWESPWAMEEMHTVALEIRLLADKVSGVGHLGLGTCDFKAHLCLFVAMV
jgi:hypothetical protein